MFEEEKKTEVLWMEELYKLLEESLNERLYQLSVGGPRNKDGDIRLKLRPVMIKTEIYFQLESFRGNQVFHENLTAGEAAEKVGKAYYGVLHVPYGKTLGAYHVFAEIGRAHV